MPDAAAVPSPVRAVRCTSCGAVVDLPRDVLSATCRFCDSPLVDAPDPGEPIDGVVPFVVPVARAAERLREELQRRWFAPPALRRARPERLHAAFVPVYAWDATVRSRFDADVGIHWQRRETYTTRENGKTVTRTRTVTETEWFDLAGAHVADPTGHLVSASKGLPEAEANALEPFDLGRAEPWAPERVAGVASERPTIPRDEAAGTARAELTSKAAADVEAFLPGDRARGVDVRADVDLRSVRLLLVPVWIALYGRGPDAVRLLVNGQTGEVVGRTPTDPGRVALVVGAALLVAALVVSLVAIVADGGG